MKHRNLWGACALVVAASSPSWLSAWCRSGERVVAREFVLEDPEGRILLRIGSKKAVGDAGRHRAIIEFKDSAVAITSEAIEAPILRIVDYAGRNVATARYLLGESGGESLSFGLSVPGTTRGGNLEVGPSNLADCVLHGDMKETALALWEAMKKEIERKGKR